MAEASALKFSKGAFVRTASAFRNTVSSDPSSLYTYEPNRYLLYAVYSCPWANRALVTRGLKKLEEDVELSILDPVLGDDGWKYTGVNGAGEKDPVFGFKYLKEVYLRQVPDYTGRFTVPVLFDKKTKTIVNNESSEIIRILNAWPQSASSPKKDVPDLYPIELQKEIDEINEWVYETVNKLRVYKCGFAQTQEAYEAAVWPLFHSLDRLNNLLENKTYLLGEGEGRLTEADVRLFSTVARFDMAYYFYFKCNWRRIQDYPNLYKWFVNLYAQPSFKSATNFTAIKQAYGRGTTVSLTAREISPVGPETVFKRE